jgi:hypothetical protein
MWPPKTKANGGSNKFYDYMTEVGDVVFSLSKKSRLCASFIIGMYPWSGDIMTTNSPLV